MKIYEVTLRVAAVIYDETLPDLLTDDALAAVISRFLRENSENDHPDDLAIELRAPDGSIEAKTIYETPEDDSPETETKTEENNGL